MPRVPSQCPAPHTNQNNARRDRSATRPTPAAARHGAPQGDAIALRVPQYAFSATGPTAPGHAFHWAGTGPVPPKAALQGQPSQHRPGALASFNPFGEAIYEDQATRNALRSLEGHLTQLAQKHETKPEFRHYGDGTPYVSKSKRIMNQISPIREALKDERRFLYFKCYMDVRRSGTNQTSIKPQDIEFLNTLTRFPLSELTQVSSILNNQELTKRISRKYSRNVSGEILDLMTPNLAHFNAAVDTALVVYPKPRRGAHSLYLAVRTMKGLDGRTLEALKAVCTTLHLENRGLPITPQFIDNTLHLIIFASLNTGIDQALATAQLAKTIQDLGLGIEYSTENSPFLAHILAYRGEDFLVFLQAVRAHLHPLPSCFSEGSSAESLLRAFSQHPDIALQSISAYGNGYREAVRQNRPNLDHRVSFDLRYIFDTPAAGMVAHATPLATNLASPPPAVNGRNQTAEPYRVNLENVMQSKAIKRTKKSILALDAHFHQRPARKEMISSIGNFLVTYPRRAPRAEAEVFRRQRGGATELRNAVRTLVGPLQPGDFSEALAANIAYDLVPKTMGLGDITALIWHAIDMYNPPHDSAENIVKDKNLMRYAVFKALSQCIEDDGHRVCAVGFTQRITSALQGYYKDMVKIDEDYLLSSSTVRSTALPAAFFTEASRSFDRSLPAGQEPSPQVLRSFVRDTLQQANDLYGTDTEQVISVSDMLKEYMRITYDWTSLES